MNKDITKPVAVKLFKDNDKYSSDVFVSVNGNNYLIRRGEGWKQSLIVQEGK